MSLTPGHRFERYEIEGLLGAGGMGAVYRARDEVLGRTVAIKTLPEELTAGDERLKRFEREARCASLLNHPNVVTIYDVGRTARSRWRRKRHKVSPKHTRLGSFIATSNPRT